MGVRFGIGMRFGMVLNRVVGYEICGCVVCLSFFFFFFFVVAVADIGGRFLICGGRRWLWAVVVDLRVWVVVNDGDDRKEIIYYFNV